MPPRKRRNQHTENAEEINLLPVNDSSPKKPCIETSIIRTKAPTTYQPRGCNDGTLQLMPTFADLMRMYEEAEVQEASANGATQEPQNVSPTSSPPERLFTRSSKRIDNNNKKRNKTLQNSNDQVQNRNKKCTRNYMGNQNNPQTTSNNIDKVAKQVDHNQKYIIMVHDSQNMQDNQNNVVYMNPSMLPKKLHINKSKPQSITGKVVINDGQVNFAIRLENNDGTVTQADIDITRFFDTEQIDLMTCDPQRIRKVSQVFGNSKNPNVAGENGSFLQNKNQSISKSKRLCPICLNILGKRSLMSTLCGHIFCMPCIKNAVAVGNNKCPICRKRIRALHALFL